MRRRLLVFVLYASVSFIGYGCSEPVPPPELSADIAAQQHEPEKVAVDSVGHETTDEAFELKRAGVGTTGKGQYGVSSEHPMSIITTPVSTYFFAQEKTVFDMQIPQALNLFQASEGRYPNSEEEFMQRIIQANQIVLPKLPEGDSYVYDVPTHTLMVRSLKASE